MTAKEDRKRTAEDEFIRLAPKGWSMSNSSVPQGGHAAVIVVKHTDGRKGVFRCLPSKSDPQLIGRFFRELEILDDALCQHRNIFTLYERTSDPETPWYISELGTPLANYWSEQRARHADDPVGLFDKAVAIVTELAEGLSVCHEAGIVHRDVKPKNVVVKNNVDVTWPILIDFGIAYDDNRRRITSSDDAVGTARFSPDVMRNRMEEVYPWIDVFDVSQLLIWMLDTKSGKHYWQRPVHWEHARYNPELPKTIEEELRAFTSLCSLRTVSPKNGSELRNLIATLLQNDNRVAESGDKSDLFGAVLTAQRSGAAKKIRCESLNAEFIETCAPTAAAVFGRIREAVHGIIGRFPRSAGEVRVSVDAEFPSGPVQKVAHRTLYWVELGDGPVRVAVGIKMLTVLMHGDRDTTLGWPKSFVAGMNCFLFAVEVGVCPTKQNGYHAQMIVGINRDGTLVTNISNARTMERNSGFYFSSPGAGAAKSWKGTTLGELVKFVVGQLSQSSWWEHAGTLNAKV